jgi:hypothetical protein
MWRDIFRCISGSDRRDMTQLKRRSLFFLGWSRNVQSTVYEADEVTKSQRALISQPNVKKVVI